MIRTIGSILIASMCVLCMAGGAASAGITQKIVTVSVPKDYHSAEAYKVEFAVPEGALAFNFTLWGSDKIWGITDISDGGHRELYSSRNGGAGADVPINDAESSERIGGPPPEDGPTDPLRTLTLAPGTYIIWMEGGPGTSMTLQYNLRTSN
jgi:hypothetical protein